MKRTASSLPLLALAVAAQASAAQKGHVLAVHSAADAQSSSVYVLADRPLSFTTLKLSGPPRVVVDFADAGISAQDRELAVNDGVIRRVALKQAGSHTARLVIELSQDAEFDVQALDKRIEVRLPRTPSQVAAATPGKGEVGQAAPAAPAEKAAGKNDVAQAAAPAAPAEKTARKDDVGQGAPVAPAEKTASAEPADEAEKRASLPKVALVGPHEVPKATESAQEPAAPQDTGSSAAVEKPQPPAESASDATASAPAASGAASSTPPGNQRKLAVKGQRRSITGIGFRPVRGGEVIVRSDRPLEYGVSGDARAVLLHLPSAAIPLANNRRPLDTRFFDGPVERVVPLAVADGTDVRIELKSGAEYQLEQAGSVLTVTFAPSR